MTDLADWSNFTLPVRTKRQTVRELLSQSTSTDFTTYDYFTGYLARSEDTLHEFPCLLDDIQPPHHLAMSTDDYNVNLWLGSVGVVAQTHYDEAPNFNLQLFGSKLWILSPPEEAHKLYPFPYLFPTYRQSQVDFGSSDKRSSILEKFGFEADKSHNKGQGEDIFPRLGNVSAFVVRVHAGEMLYIPPYYFHRSVRYLL